MKTAEKRLLALLLVLVMVVGFVPVTAMADGASIVAQGACGATEADNVNWVLTDDGVLTISGTGAMVSDFSQPWGAYNAQIKRAIFEEGVTNIGMFCLGYISSLESVSISSTIKTIDSLAFCGSGLKSINIPETVMKVDEDAFSYCTALTTATVNCDIGNSAFSGCDALESVSIGKNVKSIGMSCFWNCSSLKNVTLPAGLTTLGSSAFEGTAIASIEIPVGVKTIEGSTFKNCGALTKVKLNEGLEVIKSDAFADCISLTSINLPSTLTTIEDYRAFQNCSELTEITLPKNLTYLGHSAFSGCSGLKTITIYDKLATVSYQAFKGCTALETVNFHGTEEQWQAIEIRSDNDPLLAANVNFIDFADEKPVVKAENDKASGKVKLTITPVEGAVKYKIYVAEKAEGPFTLVKETTELTYTHNGKAGTKYFFKVVAVNADGKESAESAVVNKVQLPGQVKSLKAKSTKKKEVTLTWKKVTGAKKYFIYMSKNGKTGWKKIGTATKTKFVYKKGTPGKKLYFRVQAVTANGKKGEFSKVVSVKVKK